MAKATVDSLKILETRTWNHEMIDGIFALQKANLIILKKKKKKKSLSKTSNKSFGVLADG